MVAEMRDLHKDDFESHDLDDHNQYQIQFAQGTRTFQRLFAAWMDGNGWSHPVMTNLARCCLDGARWFHSSQISGLRQRKLASPGPRIFFAIERLNFYVHRYQTEKLLLPNTKSSRDYANAQPILEDGAPPAVGWWVEVFLGVRVPADFDLERYVFSEDKAADVSRRWGRLIRNLCARQDIDLVDDLPRIIRDTYPAGEDRRITKVAQVIRGDASWSPPELELELPAITSMSAALGGPDDEASLLTRLG